MKVGGRPDVRPERLTCSICRHGRSPARPGAGVSRGDEEDRRLRPTQTRPPGPRRPHASPTLAGFHHRHRGLRRGKGPREKSALQNLRDESSRASCAPWTGHYATLSRCPQLESTRPLPIRLRRFERAWPQTARPAHFLTSPSSLTVFFL